MKTFRYLPALLLSASTLAYPAQIKTKDEAVTVAAAAIRKFQLTTLKDDCGLIDVFEQASFFEIVVRERHTPDCGGTAETGPRLFNIRVRKRDGRLTSDVYDGTNYKPVDHKLQHTP